RERQTDSTHRAATKGASPKNRIEAPVVAHARCGRSAGRRDVADQENLSALLLVEVDDLRLDLTVRLELDLGRNALVVNLVDRVPDGRARRRAAGVLDRRQQRVGRVVRLWGVGRRRGVPQLGVRVVEVLRLGGDGGVEAAAGEVPAVSCRAGAFGELGRLSAVTGHRDAGVAGGLQAFGEQCGLRVIAAVEQRTGTGGLHLLRDDAVVGRLLRNTLTRHADALGLQLSPDCVGSTLAVV